ncbi:hypothetical protein [Brevibacillus dissolubilis]|uniref:hypothetical protein n=1 Tax=Brevibacillus dissolubilis TaxID=1844116 RepID=UPI00159B9A02|nr:hypothetical protein [Brevibacillus dissolubilis]
MWKCPYCGHDRGHVFSDNQLNGVLCLNQECGRFDETHEIENTASDFDSSDL